MPYWSYLSQNTWTLFDSTISNELETLFQRGSSTGTFDDFTVDFKAMNLKRDRKRNRILIKRGDMSANPSYSWEWEMNGKWHAYDFFDSDFLCLVESKPHLGTTVLYLGPDNTPYEIDTRAMFQKNLKTSYRRSIRKVPITLPPPPSPPSSNSNSSSLSTTATSNNNTNTNNVTNSGTSSITTTAAPAPAPLASNSSSSSNPNSNNNNSSATTTTNSTTNTNSGGAKVSSATPSTFISTVDLTGVPSHICTVINGCIKIDCNEDCVICMEPFDDINGLAHSLPECLNHGFHLECIKNQLVSQGKCPICNKIYVINEGTQPKNGTMSVRTHPRGSLSLPGYTRYGTIEINYHFPSGVQGPEHPNPGKRYSGTSRTAYLPDNPEGQEVLELFKKCFDKRLIFTVGRSITTGQDNCVVWNGIHHKTNTTGGAAHFGYPDDTYLTRVKHELSAKGFT